MRRNSWQDRVKLPSQQFGRSGTSGKLGFCQAVTTAYINTYGKTRLLVGITRTHLLVYCGRSVVNIFPPQALSSIISYTCYRQFDLSQQTQVKTKVVTRFKPCLAYCSLKMFSDQGIRSDLEATMEPHASCGGHGTLEILEIIESFKGWYHRLHSGNIGAEVLWSTEAKRGIDTTLHSVAITDAGGSLELGYLCSDRKISRDHCSSQKQNFCQHL